jgi:hypothetical protein
VTTIVNLTPHAITIPACPAPHLAPGEAAPWTLARAEAAHDASHRRGAARVDGLSVLSAGGTCRTTAARRTARRDPWRARRNADIATS